MVPAKTAIPGPVVYRTHPIAGVSAREHTAGRVLGVKGRLGVDGPSCCPARLGQGELGIEGVERENRRFHSHHHLRESELRLRDQFIGTLLPVTPVTHRVPNGLFPDRLKCVIMVNPKLRPPSGQSEQVVSRW